MTTYTSAEAARRLAHFMSDGDVLVLTGAGMSTDSGIPDYRREDGTRRVTPMTWSEFRGSEAARRRYWLRSAVGWRRFQAAKPNLAHEVIAEWEKRDAITTVITQNVDGLHGAAGSHRVIELHGNLDHVRCTSCQRRSSRAAYQREIDRLNPALPKALALLADGDADVDVEREADFVLAGCTHCGSTLVKPDVVMFGESVGQDTVAACFGALEQSRALLVLGSSLRVMSGYRFVLAARAAGKPVGIVGLGAIRGADKADVMLPVGLLPTLPLADQLMR